MVSFSSFIIVFMFFQILITTCICDLEIWNNYNASMKCSAWKSSTEGIETINVWHFQNVNWLIITMLNCIIILCQTEHHIDAQTIYTVKQVSSIDNYDGKVSEPLYGPAPSVAICYKEFPCSHNQCPLYLDIYRSHRCTQVLITKPNIFSFIGILIVRNLYDVKLNFKF